jgi:uncharacterized membrane protein SpoIIM required for sporulation
MKETKFIEKNKDKWENFERYIEASSNDPELLNEMYVQISDDLSYARTFYPNRSVRVYLNRLALAINQLIYKTQQSPWQRFRTFWAIELPKLVWESRWEFLIAFGVFGLAVLIGALSTAIDPDFPRLILGDDYVEMTLDNIKKGDPMAVYKGGWAVTDTLGITANNIFVSFVTFFLGLFASIGTIFMLLRNGIMVGAFQYFFIQKGVFWDSFLAIWLHGTLEISAIVIAGAAGITMGKGLLFPGSYRRLQAFQRSARRGFKIMVGIIPILMIAGTVEGFLTRFTDAPSPLRLSFIILSLAFIVFYFVWYPYQVHLKVQDNVLLDRPLSPDLHFQLDWQKVRPISAIFSDSFLLFTKNISVFLRLTAFLIFFYTVFAFITTEGELSTFYSFRPTLPQEVATVLLLMLNFPAKIANYAMLLSVKELPLMAIVHTLILSFAGSFTFSIIRKEDIKRKDILIKTFQLLLPVGLFQLTFSIGNTFLLLCNVLLLPFWLLWMWDALLSSRFRPLNNLNTALRLYRTRFILCWLSSFFLLIAGGTFYALAGMLDSFLWEFIALHLSVKLAMLQELKLLFDCAVGFFCLILTFSLLIIGAGFTYYSLHEIDTAEGLISRIKQINTQRQLRGLARE